MLSTVEDGSPSAPPLILGPSLGTSVAVWDPQVAALARTHRVIRWDLPGHGGSSAEAGDGLADLGLRVLELADALGIERFAYAGISLGGAVGTWLAAHHPERVASLILVCTSAHFGPPEPWQQRAILVRAKGTGPVADTAPTRWFAGASRAELVADLRATDPLAYARLCEVVAGLDLRADLARISAPTLVIGGREDPVLSVAHARELADGIPGAGLLEVAGAAHLANVDRPEAVLAAMVAHLGPSAGEATRRAVLGDEYVDRAIARITPHTRVFQDFITRYAWGEIWTRPGLDHRTRRCMTITALIAGGHHEELAVHLRAALSGGLSPAEIQEVLLQSAIYCGVPAANTAFAIADRIMAEEDH